MLFVAWHEWLFTCEITVKSVSIVNTFVSKSGKFVIWNKVVRLGIIGVLVLLLVTLLLFELLVMIVLFELFIDLQCPQPVSDAAVGPREVAEVLPVLTGQ